MKQRIKMSSKCFTQLGLLLLVGIQDRCNASLVVKEVHDLPYTTNGNENQIPRKSPVIGFQPTPPFSSQIMPPPPPTTHELRSLKVSHKATTYFAMLLASSSGLMNGACLSGFIAGSKQATAAVTSTMTTSGASLGSGNFLQFMLTLKCLLSFMGGSMAAGILVPRPVPYEVPNPRNFAVAFGCASALLVAASRKARRGAISYVFFCLAASGIQNSLTSSFTSNLCRTTHFTGMTSDIGTFMGQILGGNLSNLPKLKILSALATSFWTGGFLSYPLTKLFSQNTLLISAGIYVIVASAVLYSSTSLKKTDYRLEER
jgi:uncharacterized membrane protein YoaK (UPF0700 family)